MEPTIQAVNCSKIFPGVKALSNVSLDFYPGEVHALLGENGGKSTLIKILSGVYTPTEGYVVLEGKRLISAVLMMLLKRYCGYPPGTEYCKRPHCGGKYFSWN